MGTTKLPATSKRRTAAELRRDILAAAQEVFSEKGYAAASVREIAKRADAATPLIFRHFENKATLFATAVFEPIEKTLDENLSRADPYWVNLSPSERIRNYAELVIGTFRRNKRLFTAYMNAIVFHADEFRHLGDKLSPPSFESRIIQLERFSLEHPAGVQFLLSDPHFEVRLILLLFYSVALFDDLFFDSSERDLAREMTGVVKLVSMGIGLDPRSALAPVDGGPRKTEHGALAARGDEMNRLVHLQSEVNRLFNEVRHDNGLEGRHIAAARPKIELKETGKGCRLTAELPDVDGKDIELTLDNGVLILRAHKKSDIASRKSRRSTDRHNGVFERRIRVGDIDEKRVKATFNKGVLTVEMIRPPSVKARRMRIQIAGPTGA